jgi:hypothetical protein
MLEKNVHARSLKCSLENDLFFSLIGVQMEGWKLEQLEVERFWGS